MENLVLRLVHVDGRPAWCDANRVDDTEAPARVAARDLDVEAAVQEPDWGGKAVLSGPHHETLVHRPLHVEIEEA